MRSLRSIEKMKLELSFKFPLFRKVSLSFVVGRPVVVPVQLLGSSPGRCLLAVGLSSVVARFPSSSCRRHRPVPGVVFDFIRKSLRQITVGEPRLELVAQQN